MTLPIRTFLPEVFHFASAESRPCLRPLPVLFGRNLRASSLRRIIPEPDRVAHRLFPTLRRFFPDDPGTLQTWASSKLLGLIVMQIEPGRCENSLRQSVPPAKAGSAQCRWLDAGLKASSTRAAARLCLVWRAGRWPEGQLYECRRLKAARSFYREPTQAIKRAQSPAWICRTELTRIRVQIPGRRRNAL